jgi:radical SAM superfamily enzyme YgiQ (UPF0313 family)
LKICLYQPGDGQPPYIPFQLLSLARALRDAGIEVVLEDGRMSGGRTAPGGVDMVGLSTYTGSQIADCLRFASLFDDDVPKIWGGWHPTLLPEETAAHPLVDVVVRGQGEETLVELCKGYPGGLENIRGLTWSTESGVRSTPERPSRPINEIPRMAWDLIDVGEYIRARKGFAGYIASEGCPYRCSYCSIQRVKRRWSGLDPGTVRDELGYLVSKGLKSLRLDDNIFFLNRGWSREIMGVLGEVGVPWTASTRADIIRRIDGADLDQARRSGCYRLIIGLESGSDRTLRLMEKGATIDDARAAIGRIHEAGMKVSVHWLFGIPGETDEDREQTFRFVRSLILKPWVYSQDVYLYTPFPGAPLYDRLVQSGWKPPRGLEEWANLKTLYGGSVHKGRWVGRVNRLEKLRCFGFPGKAAWWGLSRTGIF